MFHSEINGFARLTSGNGELSGIASGRFGRWTNFELGSLPDLQLHIDLGDGIGSQRWLVGAAVLLGMCSAAIWTGGRIAPMPLATRTPLTLAMAQEVQADAIAPLVSGATTGRATSPTRLVEALAEIPERPRIEATARLNANDSLEAALRRAGVGRDDASSAAALLGDAALDRLQAGTAIDLVLGRRETRTLPRPLESLGLRAALDLRVEISRADGDGELALKRVVIPVDDTPLRISGVVAGSFADSASAAGLPERVVDDAVKTLGYAIDFQRQVGRRDRYDVVVEHRRAADGMSETGDLLYTALTPVKGNRIDMLRWSYGGQNQFFRGTGESAKKGLMRTPVNGAHLTSSFGMRFHPILGYSRLHQGVDFGAAWGSPVLAAAGGKVTFAGLHGGHGNYMQVLHHPGLMTAYAHLSRFAVRSGTLVAQGQVIGFVGSTGLSTGPHLHYEVWLNNRPVDPTALKFLGGTQLVGADLGRFKATIDRMRGLREAGVQLAESEPRKRRG